MNINEFSEDQKTTSLRNLLPYGIPLIQRHHKCRGVVFAWAPNNDEPFGVPMEWTGEIVKRDNPDKDDLIGFINPHSGEAEYTDAASAYWVEKPEWAMGETAFGQWLSILQVEFDHRICV